MNGNLKNRIQNIDNEVKNFHPFLETIFLKMPTIQKVEYTHGTNEKGADFILTKLSEELGDTEHIGIVAKIGKITQNISSVTEQIDECALRRLSANGKKEIYLSEIWIVVNGTISENAKEKIYDKFKTQKIKFVDINSLLNLAEKYFPDFGLGVAIGDTKLLNEQRCNKAQRENQSSLVGNIFNNKYLDQEIEKNEPDISRKNPIIDIYKVVETSRFSFIESQMGGGKTKLLNRLIEKYSDLDIYREKRIIPVYITARDAFNDTFCILENLKELQIKHGVQEDNSRQFIYLIDGLDEIKIEEDTLAEKISILIEKTFSSNNINLVIASREISNEKIEMLDIYRNNSYRIKPLKVTGIIKFIEEFCQNLDSKYQILEDLKRSDLFKVLPKTPIAAIILARLISEGNQDLPSNLTELYSKFCEISLGRWDIDKGLKTQKQFDALDALVIKISEYMYENSLEYMSKSEGKQIFHDYLSQRNLDINSNLLFTELIERSGIISYNKNNDTIYFKHRSFLEFFYARSLTSKYKVTLDADIFHPYAISTYFFYVGLKRDCPELLDEISRIPLNHEGHRISRLVNMAGFLLAGYQSPYANIKTIVKEMFIDAGIYYKNILDGESNKIFSKIPPIHILAIFKSLMEYGYGYKFFNNALNEISSEIEKESNNSDEFIYSLFLISAVKSYLSSKNEYDEFILNHKENIPIIIQLALGHEDTINNYKSLAIKRVQKKINKNRKTSQNYNAGILKLYNESIDNKIDYSKLKK